MNIELNPCDVLPAIVRNDLEGSMAEDEKMLTLTIEEYVLDLKRWMVRHSYAPGTMTTAKDARRARELSGQLQHDLDRDPDRFVSLQPVTHGDFFSALDGFVERDGSWWEAWEEDRELLERSEIVDAVQEAYSSRSRRSIGDWRKEVRKRVPERDYDKVMKMWLKYQSAWVAAKFQQMLEDEGYEVEWERMPTEALKMSMVVRQPDSESGASHRGIQILDQEWIFYLDNWWKQLQDSPRSERIFVGEVEEVQPDYACVEVQPAVVGVMHASKVEEGKTGGLHLMLQERDKVEVEVVNVVPLEQRVELDYHGKAEEEEALGDRST